MYKYKLTEVSTVIKYDELLLMDMSNYMEAHIDSREYLYVEPKILNKIIIQIGLRILEIDDYPWRSKTVIVEEDGYRVIVAWPTLTDDGFEVEDKS